jgi:hypothetical protein
MRRARMIFGAVAAASLISACSAILGIGDDVFTYAPDEAGAEAAPDTRVPDAPPGPDNCEHAFPPPPPASELTSQAFPTMVFAFKNLDLTGVRDGGAPVGFDLDGVCTCDPSDHSETAGGPTCLTDGATADGGTACDEDGGRDNAFNILFTENAFLGTLKQTGDLVDQIRCGRTGMLVFLGGYNGEADDTNVGVSFAPSLGIREPHFVGEINDPLCQLGDGDIPTYPAYFDASDSWSTLDGSIDEATGLPPLGNALKGYVTGWQLVADGRNSTQRMIVSVGGISIAFTTPVLTARIVPLDAGTNPPVFALADGVMSGRIDGRDLLAFAATAPIREPGRTFSHLCEPKWAQVYPFIKGTLCGALDIRSSRSDDKKGLPCNALSFTAQFEAVPATKSEISADPLDRGCDGGFSDSCDSD